MSPLLRHGPADLGLTLAPNANPAGEDLQEVMFASAEWFG